MPKLAANLSMMFTEVPFLERFSAAADMGFKGVEYLFPYDHPAETIAQALRDNGLQNVLFNLPPGNWETGDRGLAALPGREADFRGLIEKALEKGSRQGRSELLNFTLSAFCLQVVAEIWPKRATIVFMGRKLTHFNSQMAERG